MRKYQEEKDRLKREAMLRDPAKAFLVSDERSGHNRFRNKIEKQFRTFFNISTRLLQRCAILYQRIAAYYLHCHSRQPDTEILYGLEEAAHHSPFAQSTCYLIEQYNGQ